MLAVGTQVAGEVAEKGARARAAARRLAFTSARVRNAALHAIADALVARQDEIVEANQRDLDTAREMGLSEAMLGRLLDSVHNRYFRAIDKHLAGGPVRPGDLAEALSEVGGILARIDAGLPAEDDPTLPKFLRPVRAGTPRHRWLTRLGHLPEEHEPTLRQFDEICAHRTGAHEPSWRYLTRELSPLEIRMLILLTYPVTTEQDALHVTTLPDWHEFDGACRALIAALDRTHAPART